MRSSPRRAVALASLVLLASCQEMNAPVQPTSRSLMPDIAASLNRSGNASVPIVEREKPIREVTASKVIDSRGGTISLPEAGLTLIVPAGAVANATAFSVTAIEGSSVAYEFEPH